MADDKIEEIGMDDPSIKGMDIEQYKGRKGIVDRMFLLFNTHLKAKVHYNGRYIICHSKTSDKGECCEVLNGDPKLRFANVVCQYATNKDGALSNPFGWAVKSFIFSEQRYVDLRQIHAEHDLTKVDLQSRCDDEQYQKLTLTPCKQSALIELDKKNPGLLKKVMAEADEIRKKLKHKLGSDMTITEIKELVGKGETGDIKELSIDDKTLEDVIEDVEKKPAKK